MFPLNLIMTPVYALYRIYTRTKRPKSKYEVTFDNNQLLTYLPHYIYLFTDRIKLSLIQEVSSGWLKKRIVNEATSIDGFKEMLYQESVCEL